MCQTCDTLALACLPMQESAKKVVDKDSDDDDDDMPLAAIKRSKA